VTIENNLFTDLHKAEIFINRFTTRSRKTLTFQQIRRADPFGAWIVRPSQIFTR